MIALWFEIVLRTIHDKNWRFSTTIMTGSMRNQFIDHEALPASQLRSRRNWNRCTLHFGRSHADWFRSSILVKHYQHINIDPVKIKIVQLGSYLCTLHFEYSHYYDTLTFIIFCAWQSRSKLIPYQYGCHETFTCSAAHCTCHLRWFNQTKRTIQSSQSQS